MQRLPHEQGFGAGKSRTFISRLTVTLCQLSYRPTCFAISENLSVSLFSSCPFSFSELVSNKLQGSTTLCKLNHFRRNAIRFLKFFKETADTLDDVSNHLLRHLRIDRQR